MSTHSSRASVVKTLVWGEQHVLSEDDRSRWWPLSETRWISWLGMQVLHQTTTGAPDMQLYTPLVTRQEASATGVAGAWYGLFIWFQWWDLWEWYIVRWGLVWHQEGILYVMKIRKALAISLGFRWRALCFPG